MLHDEFLHVLRLFLDLHDYAGKKPTDLLMGPPPPPTLGQARRRSLALTAATSSWVGA